MIPLLKPSATLSLEIFIISLFGYQNNQFTILIIGEKGLLWENTSNG